MDVFISHSSKDKTAADAVVDYLEKRGITCWIAPRNIVAGTDWAAAISDAISACKVFLLVYSANSSASEQVAREMNLAETCSGIYIVPYNIDSSELSGTFRYYLTGAHWILADAAKGNYRLDALHEMIRSMLDGTTSEAAVEPGRPHSHASVPVQAAAPKRSALPITIAAIVLCAAAAVGITILVTRPTEVTVDVKTPASSSAGTPEPVDDGTVEGISMTISLNQKACAGTYTGKVNSAGLPDGDGLFNGSYINEAGSRIILTYSGSFSDGDPEGAAEVSMKEQGYSESKGSFTLVKGVFAGKAKYKTTYNDGGSFEFEGAMADGTQNGNGRSTEIGAEGDVIEYTGTFRQGTHDGTGHQTITYADGDTAFEEYSGEFRANKYEGIGKISRDYRDGTKMTFEGNFADSFIQGSGKKTLINDDATIVYEGVFSQGFIEGSGKMTITYNSGMLYEYDGSFRDGESYGKGKFTLEYTDGSVTSYIGEFENGLPNGKGVMTLISVDGSRYVEDGEFLDGSFTGNGTAQKYEADELSEGEEQV